VVANEFTALVKLGRILGIVRVVRVADEGDALNQARPNIFALNVRRPEVLYESVLEVDERVTLVG
jgi:N-methylhydantoinase A/oxoprolinase/acetone carboxylase beta subunit